MSAEVEALVLAGNSALREASWLSARGSFRAALDKGEHAGAVVGLGEALFWLGDWRGAEDALRSALRLPYDALPTTCRLQALAVLAELRIAQGWTEEAEELLEGMEGDEIAATVARTHLLQGRTTLAQKILARALDAVGRDVPESGVLLELLGEADLARGEHDKAAHAGRSLAALGTTRGWPLVVARGKRLLGHALSRMKGEPARPHIEEALAAFVRLGMPYEAARTRHILADALREVEPDIAEGEARVAQAAFQTLGATGDAAATAALLLHLAARSLSAIPTRKRL